MSRGTAMIMVGYGTGGSLAVRSRSSGPRRRAVNLLRRHCLAHGTTSAGRGDTVCSALAVVARSRPIANEFRQKPTQCRMPILDSYAFSAYRRPG